MATIEITTTARNKIVGKGDARMRLDTPRLVYRDTGIMLELEGKSTEVSFTRKAKGAHPLRRSAFL
jgi:hypothetical protein